jgi:ATP-binding cassette, subfamily B, bacterial PglK
LRNNVTLGLPSDGSDEDVMAVLRLAHLDEMVEGMPEGLDTQVGERGSRVSGGQRQRIGIARALYVKPSLLVLDEATSALDNETESRIGATLADLQGRTTTIIVAHRLSTVRSCDEVIFLDQGRVAAAGTFEEVIATNESFARLVELGGSRCPRHSMRLPRHLSAW